MRKIAFITGSRADAAPMALIIEAMEKYPSIEIVKLRTDGIYGVEEDVSRFLRREKPDMLVLLGDRYETLVSASVAALRNVPIAHLAGGDETLGSVDNYFRHAITKLSYWHFPECPRHAERIRQLGENPSNIFPLGAPSLDRLVAPRMTKEDMESSLGIRIESPFVLVCMHPDTITKMSIKNQVDEALQHVSGNTVVLSGSNADAGGEEINDLLRGWAENKSHAIFRDTYTHNLWLSMMFEADVLIGNSSGFITEGLTLMRMRAGKPKIIMVGDRQKGRYEDALDMFKIKVHPGAINHIYPFGRPGTISNDIANMLATVSIPETNEKAFHAL